ncbi:virulence factor SrfB [Dongia sedimenti]|uniref:Virulence factor SrfB n=1 Tax=Dongia sedimenti TaxID=3064282 RepID=A0ABU0YMF9_9PROT|nr:virulence factor SrfB [Rhodospirillaceae bacterium R-7]
MLAELTKFGEGVTLIAESGLQFLDFGVAFDRINRAPQAGFARDGSGALVRLDYDEADDGYRLPAQAGAAAGTVRSREKPIIQISPGDSVALLDATWLPIPILRARPGRSFDLGPTNWARARLVKLAAPDEDGFTHRLTIAIDTAVLPVPEDKAIGYLAPHGNDIGAGQPFMLAARGFEPLPFVRLDWVARWIRDAYRQNAAQHLRYESEDIEREIGRGFDVAHYLTFIGLLDQFFEIPRITLLRNEDDRAHPTIDVDLVLDVGNSRTCGILVEDHDREDSSLHNRYELALRDLSEPQHVYREPFESRLEFNQPTFGPESASSLSGRANAFSWPTIARVGPEATKLSAQRRGTEGATGLSSPKRYLWDEESYLHGWRFNQFQGEETRERLATAYPYCQFINEAGEPLYTLEPGDPRRIPVFDPHYSRSSLMMIMLSEVLLQALSQINSPMQRTRQAQSNLPRRLRRVVLTVPPSMPLPEQRILKRRMDDAVTTVWKAMSWHDETAAPDDETHPPKLPFPEIIMKWDEATCGQVVYLFSECANHFGGDPRLFFKVMRRRDVKPSGDERLRIGTIDIGGGTTDLVVTDYVLLPAEGNAVKIEPRQLFRDGFRLAGDDIVLETIKSQLLPAIEAALTAAGATEIESLLSRLIGSENLKIEDQVLRQQFTAQVLVPAAITLLHLYENYDPVERAPVRSMTIEDLLEGRRPQERAIGYFNKGVRRSLGNGDAAFDVLKVPVPVDLDRLHDMFIGKDIDLNGPLSWLSEVVARYACDVLLLTGRPSRLPGVQELVRSLMPVSPDRVVALHNYRAGAWYPFHRHGRIQDPKTTAAVGAMLCVLAEGRLPNFSLLSQKFDLKSTMRYFGRLDGNNLIQPEDVYFSDIDLDDPDYQLPNRSIVISGPLRLGFRQLATPYWTAAPLYSLSYREDARAELHNLSLLVTLELDRSGGNRRAKAARDQGLERFRIARVAVREPDGTEGRSIGKDRLVLRFKTLNSNVLEANDYWLDTGSVLV